MNSKQAVLRIKATTYHGRAGFLLYGGGPGIYGTRIFTATREEAQRMRDEIKQGKQPTFDSECPEALLDQAAKHAVKQVFTPEGQARPDAEQRALGILIARYAQYDCATIFKVVYAAMEDANMHTENAALVETIRQGGWMDVTGY